jgi:hypothetical protein
VDSQDEEKEFHPLVKTQSKEIFVKDSIYFDVKTTLKSASGIGSIPDAYVIELAEPYQWFVIENELATKYSKNLKNYLIWKRSQKKSLNRKRRS